MNFKKSVFLLVSSGALSQVLPVIFAPVLTRLYSPSQFGEFSLFVSIITIVSVMATGRLELAMFSAPAVDREGLRALAIRLSAITSVLSLVIFLYVYGGLFGLLLAITLLLYSTYQVNYCYQNAFSLYKLMAMQKVTLSVVLVISQIFLYGYLEVGNGLIVGFILAYLFIFILQYFVKINRLEKEKVAYVDLLNRYKRYPIFLLPGHLLNNISRQAPNLLIPMVYGLDEAGFFILIQRILGAPVSIISNSVADVFKKEAAEAIRMKGECRAIWLALFKRMLIIAVIGLVFGYLVIDFAVIFLFGESWATSSDYAKLLLPMFALQFIASPLSSLFYIRDAQRHDLVLQISIFCLTLPIFILADEAYLALFLYSISYCMIYVYVMFATYFYSGVNNEKCT